jgi:hypothetical protein
MKKKRRIIIASFILTIITFISVFIYVSASGSLPYYNNNKDNILLNDRLPGGPTFVRNDDTTGLEWLGEYRYPTIYQGRYGSSSITNDNSTFNVSGVGQVKAFAGQPFYHLVSYDINNKNNPISVDTSTARNVIETSKVNENTIENRYGGDPKYVMGNLEPYNITNNNNRNSSYGEFYYIQDLVRLSGGIARNTGKEFDGINGTRLYIIRTSKPDITGMTTSGTLQTDSQVTFTVKGYEYVSQSRNRVAYEMDIKKDGKLVTTRNSEVPVYSTKGKLNPNKANEEQAGYFEIPIKWTPSTAGTYEISLKLFDEVQREVTKTTTVTIKDVPKTGTPFLEIEPLKATVEEGKTQPFKAYYTDATGVRTEVTKDTNITWSTVTTSIATIGPKTGLATAVRKGITDVKAIYKTVSAVAEITVWAGTPPPPPPPEIEPEPDNKPPSVTIHAPKEVKAGDPICISASASDEDGTIQGYSWNTPNMIGAVNGSSSCGVYYLEEGTQEVSVTVVDDKGATGTDTVLIDVIPPTPVASFKLSGWFKENRRIDGVDTSISPLYYPIVWEKSYFEISSLNAENNQYIRVKLDSTNKSGYSKFFNENTFQSLFKMFGDYKIKLHVENTAGLLDTAEGIFNVIRDEKPISDYSTVTTVYRDPNKILNGKPYARIFVTNKSYSIDGDIIGQSIYRLPYDSNNNSNHYDDTFMEFDSKKMTPGQQYEMEHLPGIYATMDEKMNLELLVPKVGKYPIELEVVEKFGTEGFSEKAFD